MGKQFLTGLWDKATNCRTEGIKSASLELAKLAFLGFSSTATLSAIPLSFIGPTLYQENFNRCVGWHHTSKLQRVGECAILPYTSIGHLASLIYTEATGNSPKL